MSSADNPIVAERVDAGPALRPESNAIPAPMHRKGVRCVGMVLRRVDCNDGVASHIETLIAGLVGLGVKVVLLTGRVGFDDKTRMRYDALNSLVAEWVRLELPRQRFGVSLRVARQITAVIRRHDIDVLHLHGFSSLPPVRLAGLLSRQLPVVVTAHPSGSTSPGPHGLVKHTIRVLQPLLRRFFWPDRAIAISSEVRNWFTDTVRMAPARVRRILNGINVDHLHPPTDAEKTEARRALGVSPADFVVSLVGRYEPPKGHELLLDAAARAGAAAGGWRLLLVGTGDYGDAIRAMVHARNLDRAAELLGYVADLRTVYWASDAVVLPSLVEGFGLVTAEAMACGAVPLRTPTGGAADQITDGVDGFIFPFGDAPALAERLNRLRTDPSLRSAMACRAAQTARAKFSDRVMAQQTLQLYESAAADRGLRLT